MKKFLFSSAMLIIFGMTATANASAGVCLKCEKAREYNRTHPNKYTYYEDYLEAKDQGIAEEDDNDENNTQTSTQNGQPSKVQEQKQTTPQQRLK